MSSKGSQPMLPKSMSEKVTHSKHHTGSDVAELNNQITSDVGEAGFINACVCVHTYLYVKTYL